MAKFLIGVVTGFVLTVMTAVLLVFSLARFGAERKPVVADDSVLILRLEGAIPERAPVELGLPFLESQSPPTVLDTWSALKKAAVDSRIKAVVLQPRRLAVGWGKLQELRGALLEFRKSGKPLVAYLKGAGTREYYLASAADHIYFGPEEYLDVKGLRAEMLFFRRTFDKIGVQVEVEHAGKYKDYGDMWVRENMSPETREVLDSVLDDLYGHLVSVIAESRKKKPEEIRALIDQGPFLANKAKEAGLVDDLIYEDQMLEQLKKRIHLDEMKRVSFRDYVKVPASSLGLEGGARIAVLVGEGGIERGSSSDDGMGSDGIGAEGFNKLLRRVGDDKTLKGVVVRIDSPGGDSMASDDIWREMNLLSKKKPLVISMSDVAASGGYYMAMTGDTVVAYPATFTGSIGVVYGKANLKGLYDKIGVTKDRLTRGRFADIDSDYGPLSDDARRKLREGIDRTYTTFVTKVAGARKRKFDEIEPLAQGRVWLGSQAKRNGLVDELGGLDRAFELLRQKAKLPKDEKLTLVTYPPRRTIFDVLFGRSTESVIESLSRTAPFAQVIEPWQIRLWSQGGFLALMPYTLEVK